MRRRATAVFLTLAVLTAACGADSSAVGVVTAFDGDLQTVNSFTLRTVDGRDLTFIPELEDGGSSFPLPHLQEHLSTGERIRVRWEERADGSLVAVAITDA